MPPKAATPKGESAALRELRARPRERQTMPDGRVYELEPNGDGSFNVLWVITCPECEITIVTPYGASQSHRYGCSRHRMSRTA